MMTFFTNALIAYLITSAVLLIAGQVGARAMKAEAERHGWQFTKNSAPIVKRVANWMFIIICTLVPFIRWSQFLILLACAQGYDRQNEELTKGLWANVLSRGRNPELEALIGKPL